MSLAHMPVSFQRYWNMPINQSSFLELQEFYCACSWSFDQLSTVECFFLISDHSSAFGFDWCGILNILLSYDAFSFSCELASGKAKWVSRYFWHTVALHRIPLDDAPAVPISHVKATNDCIRHQYKSKHWAITLSCFSTFLFLFFLFCGLW